jgi:alpha-tubulin suppressor-like RCC1 family protein
MPKKEFIMAECSDRFTFLVTITGTLFACGTSKYGEMGCYSNQISYTVESPQQVLHLPKISDVACGLHHSLAIQYDTGEIYGWGNPQNGKLGLGNTGQSSVPTPTLIYPLLSRNEAKPRFTNVACANVYSVAVDTDGNVWYTGIKKYEYNANLDGR